MNPKPLSFVLGLLAASFVLGAAEAATYNVDRTDDVHTTVATACDDAVANDCSLRDAIRKANQNADASNTVVVPAGIYSVDIATPGEDNAFNGDLDITKDLTIQGAGADPDCGSGSTCVDEDGAVIDEDAFTVLNNANVTFSGLTVRNSKHSGIIVSNSAPGGLVTVTDCALVGNHTGLSTVGPAGEVVIRDSLIAGNVGNGGVVNNNFKMTIEDSTLSGNSATGSALGGGVSNFGSTGDLTIANSTISGNSTDGSGGGVNNTASVVLRNVTITGNEADLGGGIYTAGDVLFENSIIAGNTGVSKGPDCLKHATLGLFDSKGHNLIGTTVNCAITPASTDIAGTVSSPVDPKLGVLADNGGKWETHLPLDGSLVIDGGDPAGCSDANGARTADQRGLPSPADGDDDGTAVCDIGAVEVQPESAGGTAGTGGGTAGTATGGATSGETGGETGGDTAGTTGGTSGSKNSGGCSLIRE